MAPSVPGNVEYSSDFIAFNTHDLSASASAYQILTHRVVGQSYTVQYELGEQGNADSHTMLATVQYGAAWNAGTQLAAHTYTQTSLTTTLHSFTFTSLSSNATRVFTNTVTSPARTTGVTLNQASVMTTDEAARHGATPLLQDLNGDGVQTVAVDHGVLFDVANTGVQSRTAWVYASDGLLVRDISHDGQINNGAELLDGKNCLRHIGSGRTNASVGVVLAENNPPIHLSTGNAGTALFYRKNPPWPPPPPPASISS